MEYGGRVRACARVLRALCARTAGKHGTCASQLEQYDTQYKFFSAVLGLKFSTPILVRLSLVVE